MSDMNATVSWSMVGCTSTPTPAGAFKSTSTGAAVNSQVFGLDSSQSALPTVVRAPPDGNAPPPWPAPGGAGANGSLGQALIVYVTGRPYPAGSAISGVTVSAGLLPGATIGFAGSP